MIGTIYQMTEGKGDEPQDCLEEERPGAGDSQCKGPEAERACSV